MSERRGEQLTQEELQALIQVVAQYVCPVAQAPPFQELINKMSRMIDQLKKRQES